MPKRPSDEFVGGRSAKLSTRPRRKHLYLVLEDWELGYSIRKIDLPQDSGSDFIEQSTDDACKTEQCLPRAVFRFEGPHECSGLFAAFGLKIMFTGVRGSPWGIFPMYDVHKRSLTAVLQSKSYPIPDVCVYVEVDGKLFLLDDSLFEVLKPLPPPVDDIDARLKVKFDWSWHKLPKPRYQIVVSHAVHPDGRTMVFSMVKYKLNRRKLATFSFNIDSSRWTRHGAWGLPFKGRGFFDRDLDVWVGLSCDPNTLGYLCACDVLSGDTKNGRQPAPACKLSKEKLFCVDPTEEEHIGATLVYVGERSSFCLVQCLYDDRQGSISKELPRCLLRVTTFSLKYDKNGDLRIAKHRQIGSYQLPETAGLYREHLERPIAFWI